MTIADVRRNYVALRDHALVISPDSAGYIRGLWESWDGMLGTFGDETDLGDPPYLIHLTRTIADPSLPSDAVLEWLDAYPDNIVDRLPGGLFAEPVLT